MDVGERAAAHAALVILGGAGIALGVTACSGPEEDLFANTEAASAASGSSTGSGGAGAGSSSASSGAEGGVGPGSGGAGGEGAAPPSCGNGQIDSDEEECDGADLGAATCVDFGFTNPAGLLCTSQCTIDPSGCATTCDGAGLERGEECDGELFQGSCVNLGYSNPDGLICVACDVDPSGCQGECGDGEKEPDEACDGADLDGQSCVDHGYVSAAGLACAPGCQAFDSEGCAGQCNGVLEPDEVCDGANLGGHDCTEFDFVAPAGLACTQCQLNPSGCKPTCGNLVIEPGEDCDDGGVVSGDGCSATCKVEGTACDDAVVVSVDLGPAITLTGTTVGGGQHGSAGCPAAGHDRTYAVAVESDGYLTATLTRPATNFDSVLYARLDCASAATLACANSQGNAAGGGEVISFQVKAGQTVFVFVDGVSTDGDYALTLNLSTGNSCFDPIPITIEEGSAMTFTGNTNNAGNDESSSCGGATADDVVYRIVRTQSGALTLGLDPTATTYDSVLYAQPVCGVGLNSQCDNEAGNGGESIALPSVTGGDPLYAWVDGLSGAEGSYALVVTP